MPDLAELNLVVKSQEVVKATADLEKLAAGGKHAEDATTKVTKASREAGQAHTEHSRGLELVHQGFERYLPLVVELSTALGVLGVAFEALHEFAKEDAIQRGIATLTGSVEKAKELAEEVAKIGNGLFSKEGQLNTARSLLAYGADPETVVKSMKAAADAAAALGGGEQQLQGIARALVLVQEGGVKAQRAFFQLRAEGINAFQLIGDKIGKTALLVQQEVTNGSLSPSVVAATLTSALAEKFKGGVDNQLAGISGQMTRLKNEGAAAMAELGRAIAGAFGVTGGLKGFADWIERLKHLLGDIANYFEDTGNKGGRFKEVLATVTDVAKLLLVGFEALIALKLVAYFAGIAEKAAAGNLSMTSLSGTAGGLLSIVVAVGAAMAGWHIGTELYNQFRAVRDLGNTMAFQISHPLDYAAYALNQARGMKTYRAGDNSYFQGFSPNQSQKSYAADSPTGVYLRTNEDIYKEPNNISKSGGGLMDNLFNKAEFTKNIREMMDASRGNFDTARAAAAKLYEELSHDTKEQAAGGKAVETTIDARIAKLQKERELIGLGSAEVKIRNELEKAGQADDIKGKSFAEQKLAALRTELELLDRAKALDDIEKQIRAKDEELQLINYTGEALRVEVEMRKLINKYKEDGIKLDDQDIAKLKQKVVQQDREKQAQDKILEVSKATADAVGKGLEDMLLNGKSFRDAMLQTAKEIEAAFVKAFLIKPLTEAVGGTVQSFLSNIHFGGGGGQNPNNAGATPATPAAANGAVFGFAAGDIFSSPTYFRYGSGRTGLMGEAGPEAVMPLTRGRDGKLGVRTQGGGSGPPTVHNHYWNIRTPDADSFRKSQRQVAFDARRAIG